MASSNANHAGILGHQPVDANDSDTAATRERSRAAAAVIEAQEELLEAKAQAEIKAKYCTEMLKRLQDANAAVDEVTAKATLALKEVDRAVAERSVAETYEAKARKNKQDAVARVTAAERALNLARRRLRSAEEAERMAENRSRRNENRTSSERVCGNPGRTHSGTSLKRRTSAKNVTRGEVPGKADGVAQSMSLPTVSEDTKRSPKEEHKPLHIPAVVEAVLAARGFKLRSLNTSHRTVNASSQARLGGTALETRGETRRHVVSRSRTTSTRNAPSNRGNILSKPRSRKAIPPSYVCFDCTEEFVDESLAGGGKSVIKMNDDSTKNQQAKSIEVIIPAQPIASHHADSKSMSPHSSATISLRQVPGEWRDDSLVFSEGFSGPGLPPASVSSTPVTSIPSNDVPKTVTKNTISAPCSTTVTDLAQKISTALSGSSVGDAKVTSSSENTSQNAVLKDISLDGKGSSSNLSHVSNQRHSRMPIHPKTHKLLASLESELAIPPPVVKWTDFIPPKPCESRDESARILNPQLLITSRVHSTPDQSRDNATNLVELVSLGGNAKDKTESGQHDSKKEPATPLTENSSSKKEKKSSELVLDTRGVETKLSPPHLQVQHASSHSHTGPIYSSDRSEASSTHSQLMKQVKFSECLQFSSLSPDVELRSLPSRDGAMVASAAFLSPGFPVQRVPSLNHFVSISSEDPKQLTDIQPPRYNHSGSSSPTTQIINWIEARRQATEVPTFPDEASNAQGISELAHIDSAVQVDRRRLSHKPKPSQLSHRLPQKSKLTNSKHYSKSTIRSRLGKNPPSGSRRLDKERSTRLKLSSAAQSNGTCTRRQGSHTRLDTKPSQSNINNLSKKGNAN